MSFCTDNGVNVFIPHYYGSWLSDGVFTPEDCLQSIEDTFRFISLQKGIELYNHSVARWQNKETILCGSSFGGLIAINSLSLTIEKIALFAPLIDLKTQGQIEGEEKMPFALNFIRDVFKNGYRGIEKPIWEPVGT